MKLIDFSTSIDLSDSKKLRVLRFKSVVLPTTIKNGPGSCTQCSCPEFFGSDYTCHRSECNHHYDEHW